MEPRNTGLTGGGVARCAALVNGLREWVQLLPAGTFQGVDGRGPYHVTDPEAVIRLTRERAAGADLPIDYGHALEVEGPEGDGARAAGWITAMEARDGEIWGRIQWTDRGAAAVRAREYRFLSPVFAHDASGVVLRLLRAGLTNRPNLKLKALNSQRNGGTMAPRQDERAKVEQLLGLAPGTLDAAEQREAEVSRMAEEIGPDGRAVCAALDISYEDYIKNLAT